MNDPVVHAWFRSTTGRSVMSHNGSPSGRGKLGTLGAFRNAYRDGYRWFQVDALPIKDDLVSQHAVFGRKRGFMKKDRDAVRAIWPHVPSLIELLTADDMLDARWNIEMKSKKGLRSLLTLLGQLRDAGRDLSTIMISSPMRPSVLEAVAAEFPNVALSAPVIHGGVFGVRLLGRKRARTGSGPYDCQQCLALFVRKERATTAAPLRQAWTISRPQTLDRILGTEAHPIVNSRALVIRRWRPADTPVFGSTRPTAPASTPPQVDALALGGGGWRGAFGGIGAIMYFADAQRWATIRDVVGISGGSFSVGALSRRAKHHESEVEDSDGDPAPALAKLLNALEVAGRRTASIVGLGAIIVVGVVVLVVLAMLRTSNGHGTWAMLVAIAVLLSTSYLLRLVATLRWRGIVRSVFGDARMRMTAPADDDHPFQRRYAIGATGLNDGRLYSFTSHPAGDTKVWLDDRDAVATPLGDRRVRKAVVRATSLPGLGQLGARKLWLPMCQHDGDRHEDDCDWVPDRLVDGGISGIFGRGLVQAKRFGQQPDVTPMVVVVDAGRSLVINNDHSVKDRASSVGERITALLLLARWLKVALFVAYRDELARVQDNQVTDGYCYRLVRLAEEEQHPGADELGFCRKRYADLNRLYVLRDQVHRFSLVKASRNRANKAVTVAVAACALEFERAPDLELILGRIGAELGRGNELAEVWRDIRVPLLGKPGETLELGPPKVCCADPVDERVRFAQVSG